MGKTFTLSILIFSLFISSFCGSLHILMPDKLEEWWKTYESEIQTSIAAFGVVPWGRKIFGKLVLANPENACDYIRTPKDLPRNPILVTVRGDCPFYLKAHYAQLAGARMLIVIDNKYEEVNSKLMVDSAGQGEAIRIPSILLSRKAGDKLLEFLKSTDNKVNNIKVRYDFNLERRDNVKYNLWLSSGNTQSYRFIRDFRQYEQMLSNDASVDVHFTHFSTTLSPGDPNVENCACGGAYCAADPDGDLPNNGVDVLMEDLRQLCILKQYGKETWWAYALSYEEGCLFGRNMTECSETILNYMNVDPSYINSCVKNSFQGRSVKECTKNTIFDEERAAMTREGVFLVPSVTINGFQFRGNLLPAHGVFEAICESFNKMPQVCVGKLDQAWNDVESDWTEPEKRHYPIVGSALLFLAIFSFFVFCCYKRYLKREMYKQMVRDVNIAVSQYIAFKDEDEKEKDEKTEAA